MKPIFLEKIIFSEQEHAKKRVAVTSSIILPKDILLLHCCQNDARRKQKPWAVAVVIATADSNTQLSNISITANEFKFIPPLKHE